MSPKISVALRSLWPWLLVLAVGLFVVRPFLSDSPLSHDHPVRIYQAWNFWTELLSKGKLRGWSPYYGFGYPAGELYPFGAEAWVALFRALTFGTLSWLRTYGLALAGALIFAAFGLFSFTRRQFGTGAAVIAAILNLLDPGGWAEGGWYWHTDLGVWPVTLAMGMVLFALAKLSDVLMYRRRRDIPIASALIAVSLLTHLLPLTVYPICIPILLLDRHLRDGQLPASAVCRLICACAIGFGLAAFSVIPMMARTNLTLDLGVQGVAVADMGRSLANGTVWVAMWPPLFVLGIIGALFALGEPKQLRPFAPLVLVVALLLATNWFVHDLHLERVVSGLIKVEARRFLLVAKLFFYPLVGHAVVTIVHRTVLAKAGARAAKHGRRVAVTLAVLALLPVAYPTARALYMGQVFKVVQTPNEAKYWTDLSQVLDWTNAQRRSSKDFYRVAYALPMHDHLSGIAPMFDRTMMYKIGYTPAGIFNRFPMSGEPELLEALSVKYLVSEYAMGADDFALERTVGQLKVYRFNRYRPEPFQVIGQGHGSLLGFEAEDVRIRVSGVDAASRLKLHVASFPAWRATLDGAELPISTVTVHDGEYPMLMEVPVAHDGLLELRYVRRFVDWLGFGVSVATLTLLAAAIAVGPNCSRAPVLRRIAQPLQAFAQSLATGWNAHRTLAYALSGIALVMVGVLLWVRAKPPLPPDSLFRNDALSVALQDVPCVRKGFASYQCGEETVEASVQSGIYGAHLCMHAPFGPLTVRLDHVPAPRFIAGRYDVARGSGQIAVTTGDRILGLLSTRDPSQGQQFFQFDTRAEGGKPLDLKFTLDGAPLHCFDLSLVP